MSESPGAKRPPIVILYEDDCYVVFDKPAGLLVIPTPKKETNTLIHLANEQYFFAKPQFLLHPCHRLDRETSGAIIFAKGKKNQQMMMREFFKGNVRKKYIAFVNGHPRRPQGTIRSPIVDLDQKKFSKKDHRKMAVTQYRILQTRRHFSVLEAIPVTGRTNQIRIHFAQMGHPILGDRKYGRGKDFLIKFKRVALHASELQWVHPVYRKGVKIHSHLPEDMQQLMN